MKPSKDRAKEPLEIKSLETRLFDKEMGSVVLASSLSGCETLGQVLCRVFHVWEQKLNPEPCVVPQYRNGALSGAQVPIH